MVDWETASRRLVDIDSYEIREKSMKIDTGRREITRSIPTMIDELDIRLEHVKYCEETDSLHVLLIENRD